MYIYIKVASSYDISTIASQVAIIEDSGESPPPLSTRHDHHITFLKIWPQTRCARSNFKKLLRFSPFFWVPSCIYIKLKFADAHPDGFYSKYKLPRPKDWTPLLCHFFDSTSLTSGLYQKRCADLLEWVKRLPHASFTRRKLLATSSLTRALHLFIQISRKYLLRKYGLRPPWRVS